MCDAAQWFVRDMDIMEVDLQDAIRRFSYGRLEILDARTIITWTHDGSITTRHMFDAIDENVVDIRFNNAGKIV